MTDHDEPDTKAAPTGQASPPVTELTAAGHDDTFETISPDEVAEGDSATRRKWYVRPGLLIVVLLVAGMNLVNPAAMHFSSSSSKQAAPVAKPKPTIPVNAQPSAPSKAPDATQAPPFSANDENFLSLMSQEGWGCFETSGVEQCKQQMVGFAHQICSNSGQSIDVIYQNFSLPEPLGPGEKRMAIVNAEQSYPNCTFTKSP